MATTFIYTLLDPNNGQVRYVGKSDNPKKRLYYHLVEAKRLNCTHRHHWLNRLSENKSVPTISIVEECDKNIWQEREKYWITYYRNLGYNLVNGTDGGDGRFGYVVSDKTKKLVSEKLRGRVFSEESKSKMSNSLKGIVFSNDRKDKMSIAKLGKKRKNSTSKYYGVSWDKRIKKWASQATFNRKPKHLGFYADEMVAAKVRDEFVIKNNLNLPLNFT